MNPKLLGTTEQFKEQTWNAHKQCKKKKKHKNLISAKKVILFKPAFQNKLTRNSMSFRRGGLQGDCEHAQLYLHGSSFPSVAKKTE